MASQFTVEFTNSNLQFTDNAQSNMDQMGKLYVRIRNLGELYEIESLKIVNFKLKIQTKQALFAVASGQSSVFYDEQGVIVAGGIIGD